ncbi:hypothetical protein BGZ79_001665, partial [Entomortierella chlamydospora]
MSKRPLPEEQSESAPKELTFQISASDDVNRMLEVFQAMKDALNASGNITISIRNDASSDPDPKRQKKSGSSDSKAQSKESSAATSASASESSSSAPPPPPPAMAISSSRVEQPKDKTIWWLNIEREITIAFFETAKEGLKFLRDHGLEPIKRRLGDYYAIYDTRENIYKKPIFLYFYRRSGEHEEYITLEEVSMAFQLCDEHD